MIKTKRNRKWEIPHTVLERRTLWFSSYKNRKLKVKLWWVGARERKKSVFFCTAYFVQNLFNICALSHCITYWIHFRNIRTFMYQKTLLHTLFCLFFKIVKSLHCFLKKGIFMKDKKQISSSNAGLIFAIKWFLHPVSVPQWGLLRSPGMI